MITSVNKKMICVKDIPSNIIEEAIIILKKDVSIAKSPRLNKKRKEIITSETEEFVKEYMKKIENENLSHRKRIWNKKIIFGLLFGIFVMIAFYISFSIFG